MNCFYKTLGLEKNASTDDIKKAYRRLAMKYHPDKNPKTEEIFKRISAAYQVLSDPQKKSEYDACLLNKSREFHFVPRNPFDIFMEFNQVFSVINSVINHFEEIAFNGISITVINMDEYEFQPNNVKQKPNLLTDGGSRINSEDRWYKEDVLPDGTFRRMLRKDLIDAVVIDAMTNSTNYGSNGYSNIATTDMIC